MHNLIKRTKKAKAKNVDAELWVVTTYSDDCLPVCNTRDWPPCPRGLAKEEGTWKLPELPFYFLPLKISLLVLKLILAAHNCNIQTGGSGRKWRGGHQWTPRWGCSTSPDSCDCTSNKMWNGLQPSSWSQGTWGTGNIFKRQSQDRHLYPCYCNSL